VLAGHYDKKDGSPAVFWDLNKLQKGDKITVIDDKGEKQTFSVIKLAKYPYDNFPLKEVFGDSEKPMLNLITCQGTWNDKSNTYAERLVVYAQLDQ
jgi:sortase (surface protein transpeptidase)